MKFLFADESYSNRYKFIVIAGLCYDANMFQTVEDNISKFCSSSNIDTIEVIKDRRLSKEQRDTSNLYIAELLNKINAKILCVVVREKRDIATCLATRLLTERYVKELKKYNDIGLIFYDEDTSRTYIKKYGKKNYGLIKIGKNASIRIPVYISDDELHDKVRLFLFVNNKECFSIQVASLIASAVEKAVNNLYSEGEWLTVNNVETLSQYFYCLQHYWPLFSRSPKGKVYGWGIKPW